MCDSLVDSPGILDTLERDIAEFVVAMRDDATISQQHRKLFIAFAHEHQYQRSSSVALRSSYTTPQQLHSRLCFLAGAIDKVSGDTPGVPQYDRSTVPLDFNIRSPSHEVQSTDGADDSFTGSCSATVDPPHKTKEASTCVGEMDAVISKPPDTTNGADARETDSSADSIAKTTTHDASSMSDTAHSNTNSDTDTCTAITTRASASGGAEENQAVILATPTSGSTETATNTQPADSVEKVFVHECTQLRAARDEDVTCFAMLTSWRESSMGIGLLVQPRSLRERSKKLLPTMELVRAFVKRPQRQ